MLGTSKEQKGQEARVAGTQGMWGGDGGGQVSVG